MADTISSSDDLKIEVLFIDGDTRTITLKDPSTAEISDWTATAGHIENLMNGVLIGDKYGGAFSKILLIKRVTTNKVALDISPDE